MPRVVRSEQAERDLDQILDYLDDHRPAAAKRLARAINEKSAILARFPELGRDRDELSPGLRSFNVGGYLLFFRPIDDGIEVIRIVHGARDYPTLFN